VKGFTRRGRGQLDWWHVSSVRQNDVVMRVDSRDSVSLKPAELDEIGQLLGAVGLPLRDDQLDQHVEQFPLVTLSTNDDELHGFLFGSLERIGGTPCILWGLGAIRRGRDARGHLDGLVGELYRRAAISFPDEDVLVAGRFAQPSGYALLTVLTDVCPRPKYSPTGEERAWGRRLARRYGCDARYDDRQFRLKAGKVPELVLHAAAVKAGGKSAAEVVGTVEPVKGEAVIAFGWATAEALLDGLSPNGKH
jgi:hypothetical protein